MQMYQGIAIMIGKVVKDSEIMILFQKSTSTALH